MLSIKYHKSECRNRKPLYDPAYDEGPYLAWVPERLRAMTIDPARLPSSHSAIRRKILMMSSTYMTGGAEVFAVNAAKAIAPWHDVYLWTQRPGNYTIQGDLPLFDSNPADLARDLDCDLVIYNNGAGFWHNETIHAQSRAKTVLCLHGLVRWTADQFRGHVDTIRSIDAFWAFSSVAGGMRAMGFDRPAYELHCPVDDDGFRFHKRRWDAPFRIGYVGRVSVEKNLDAVLSLWWRIWCAMGDAVRFDFIGGLDPTNNDPQYLDWLGPVIARARALPEWECLVAAGALTDHGYCERARVKQLVRDLHVLTLASDFEGEPVVFTEAMASGALCSFRRVGEVDRQLEGVGLLSEPQGRKVTAGELDSMAAGIVDVLSRPAECERLVTAARARYEQRHAPNAWAANFERMMEDILR